MFKKFGFFLLAFIFSQQLAALTVEVGGYSGAPPTLNSSIQTLVTPIICTRIYPLDTYSDSVSYYKQGELHFQGMIDTIRFYKTNTSGYTEGDGQLAIYLKHHTGPSPSVGNTTFTTAIANATLVYTSVTQNLPPTIGWTDFTLTTPFTYNNIDNLLVIVRWYRPSPLVAGTSITWKGSYLNNLAFVNSNTISTSGNSGKGQTADPLHAFFHFRPNVQFEVPAGINIPAPPISATNLLGLGSEPNSITWSWTDNSTDEDGFIITELNNSYITTMGPDITSLKEDNLIENTIYGRSVRTFNNNGEAAFNTSSWRDFSGIRNAELSDFSLTTVSDTEIQIVCNRTVNSSKGYTAIQIERSIDRINWVINIPWDNSYNFIDANLIGQTEYYYRVTYRNGNKIAGEVSPDKSIITSKSPLRIESKQILPRGYEDIPYYFKFKADLGVPPYVWDIVTNQPSWVSFNNNTGEITGTPDVKDVNYQISVRVTDQVADTYTGMFDLSTITAVFLPFNEDFEQDLSRYSLFINGNSRAQLSVEAGQGLGKGLQLDGQPQDINWTVSETIANDPSLWPGDSTYDSIIENVIKKGDATEITISFNFRIVNKSLREWYTNLIFEWSENAGQTWNVASGNGSVNNIYREDTNGFFTNTAITFNPSKDKRFVRFRFRWLVKWAREDTFPTWISIDNIKITGNGTVPPPFIYPSGNGCALVQSFTSVLLYTWIAGIFILNTMLLMWLRKNAV